MIAIVSSQGLGDGLLFQTIAYHLKTLHFRPTLFNDSLLQLQSWLPDFHLKPQPSLNTLYQTLSPYELIILDYDSSLKAEAIQALPIPVYTFYHSHKPSKHPPLKEKDFVARSDQTILHNIEKALQFWFGSSSRETGLTPPPHLIHRKHPERIVIHPTSSTSEKNWPFEKFSWLQFKLSQKNYQPYLLTNKENQPLFPSLEEMASFLFESHLFIGNDSGPAHLASALAIPSIVIAQNPKQMQFWKPDWLPPTLITPPPWARRFKFLRKRWKSLITKRMALKTFFNTYCNRA